MELFHTVHTKNYQLCPERDLNKENSSGSDAVSTDTNMFCISTRQLALHDCASMHRTPVDGATCGLDLFLDQSDASVHSQHTVYIYISVSIFNFICDLLVLLCVLLNSLYKYKRSECSSL